MIDVHSHLLPDIDDGSRSVAQSLDVLRRFAEVGVRDVILTPHVRASELASDPEDAVERRQVAFEVLRREAPPSPGLHLGFEILLDEPLDPGIAHDRRFSLAASRYYLVEFYLSVSVEPATVALAEIAREGAVPLVAHAERYDVCSTRTVAAWRAAGAKIQVDATTLAGSSGRARAARQLLEGGLADVAAADNHGDGRTVDTARQFLSAAGAADVARVLCTENTQAIVDDRPMTEPRAVSFDPDVWGRLRMLWDSLRR